jgi:hypothetical protein
VAQLVRKKQQNPDMASQLDIVMEQENFKVLHKQTLDLPLGMPTTFYYILTRRIRSLTLYNLLGHGSPADIVAGDVHKGVLLGMAPFMAVQMNVGVEEYKTLVKKAAANMGPYKTTIPLWGYIGQRPSDN